MCCRWAVFLFCFCANTAFASIGLHPTQGHLSQQKAITSFNITNQKDEPVLVQISAKKWVQVQGKDVYTDTQDILATPPVVTIPPKATQIVRVMRRVPASSQELTYRIYFKEILSKRKPEEEHQIRIALMLGVPVFIASTVPVMRQYSWQAIQKAPDSIVVRVTNQGNKHLRFSHMEIMSADGAQLVDQRILNYVFPRQSTEWTFTAKKPIRSPLQIVATEDSGKITESVQLR